MCAPLDPHTPKNQRTNRFTTGTAHTFDGEPHLTLEQHSGLEAGLFFRNEHSQTHNSVGIIFLLAYFGLSSAPRYLLASVIVLSIVLAAPAMSPKVLGVTDGTCGTIIWSHPGTSGDWEVAANWDLGRVPTASDDVCLEAALDPLSFTVTLSSVQTVHSILVGPSSILDCASTCTLTIKSHTPEPPLVGVIRGGLIGVAGFTPAIFLGADIYGVLNIAGNVVNDASLVDASLTSIHIDAGGTFVNVNSLDVTNGHLLNDGVFVQKCSSLLTPTPPGIHFEGSGTYLTESPCPTQVSTASGSSVSGTASFSSDLGGFTSLTSTAVSSVSPAPPAGLTFPAGLFSFTISGLRAGATVTVTITLPAPLPAGSFSYWKFQSGAWIQYSSASLDSTRTIITLTLTADSTGTINDPGGPAIPAPAKLAVSHVPVGGVMLPSVGFTVLLPWVIMLSLLGVLSMEAFRVKRRAKRR